MIKHCAFVELNAFATSSLQTRRVFPSRRDPSWPPTSLPFCASVTHAFDLKPPPGPRAPSSRTNPVPRTKPSDPSKTTTGNNQLYEYNVFHHRAKKDFQCSVQNLSSLHLLRKPLSDRSVLTSKLNQIHVQPLKNGVLTVKRVRSKMPKMDEMGE
jgi:hypothetical protein